MNVGYSKHVGFWNGQLDELRFYIAAHAGAAGSAAAWRSAKVCHEIAALPESKRSDLQRELLRLAFLEQAAARRTSEAAGRRATGRGGMDGILGQVADDDDHARSARRRGRRTFASAACTINWANRCRRTCPRFFRRCPLRGQHPPGLRQMAGQPGASADGPRDGQSLLANALWPRPGENDGRFWRSRASSRRIPSCSIGWRRNSLQRLGPAATVENDRHEPDLSPGLGDHAGASGQRPRERAVGSCAAHCD